MRRNQSGPPLWLQFESLLERTPFVTHGVFTRLGGVSEAPYASLNAGPQTTDEPVRVATNHARIAAALPGEPILIGSLPQQQSDVCAVTSESIAEAQPPAHLVSGPCDALITNVRGIALYWAVADCAVVLVVDPTHKAIGLVHAGWRGTRGAIVLNAFEAMHEEFGTEPEQCLVAIAPTIGPCCYEVDQPVYDAFRANPIVAANARFSTVRVAEGAGGERESLRLDLAESNRAQLVACGVPPDRIESANLCTGCHTDLFYSHRVEGGPTGRFAVALGLL
jgi:YfiH family protein